MADASAAAGPRDLDDLVEDEPRLASLPETDASGVAGLAVIWAVLVMVFWRVRLVDRARPIEETRPA